MIVARFYAPAGLLEPFFTTKPDGLGMGLAIARRLLEAHDGSLSFRRNPDRGLTATVRLPLTDPS